MSTVILLMVEKIYYLYYNTNKAMLSKFNENFISEGECAMKKIFAILLCIIMLLPITACADKVPNNNTGANMTFSQSMTIVKMPSPPKCKTFSGLDTIEDVLEILRQIKKGEKVDDTNGWQYMIKLNVDGRQISYTIGNVFTDADGNQYKVLNSDEILSKLDEIYAKINVNEYDYK